MIYKCRWRYGKVIAIGPIKSDVITSRSAFDSEDDVPLAEFQKMLRNFEKDTVNKLKPTCEDNIDSPFDDSDLDPTVTCEVGQCKDEVFAACPYCNIFLCFDHLNVDFTNCNHHRNSNKEVVLHIALGPVRDQNAHKKPVLPESFLVEGVEREGSTKKKKTNKQKIAKSLRNQGGCLMLIV